MSINSLTNAATARRPDFAPLNRVPNGLSEIATAAAGMPSAKIDGAKPNDGTTSANGVNTAMQVLFGYIPTEVLTLYVAIVAAIHPIASGTGNDGAKTITSGDWINFISFLVATPIIFWVVYAAKLKSAQKPIPLGFSTWPLWEMTAATVAYAAWAFALPKTPFLDFGWYTPALGSVAVLVASTVLGLLAPLFQNSLGTGEAASHTEARQTTAA
jgi:hypothetical protein